MCLAVSTDTRRHQQFNEIPNPNISSIVNHPVVATGDLLKSSPNLHDTRFRCRLRESYTPIDHSTGGSEANPEPTRWGVWGVASQLVDTKGDP